MSGESSLNVWRRSVANRCCSSASVGARTKRRQRTHTKSVPAHRDRSGSPQERGMSPSEDRGALRMPETASGHLGGERPHSGPDKNRNGSAALSDLLARGRQEVEAA